MLGSGLAALLDFIYAYMCNMILYFSAYIPMHPLCARVGAAVSPQHTHVAPTPYQHPAGMVVFEKRTRGFAAVICAV